MYVEIDNKLYLTSLFDIKCNIQVKIIVLIVYNNIAIIVFSFYILIEI